MDEGGYDGYGGLGGGYDVEREAERARFAAGRRGVLLGWAAYPPAVWSLLMSADDYGLLDIGDVWFYACVPFMVVGSVVLNFLERRPYEPLATIEGHVPGNFRYAIGSAAFVVAAFPCYVADVTLDLGVSLMGVVLAVMLWVFYAYYGDRKDHYAHMAVAVLCVSALPALDVAESPQLFAHPPFMAVAVGLVLLVGGYYDHKLLRDSMRPGGFG